MPPLAFVADHAKEGATLFGIVGGFYSLWRDAIDHAKHTPALIAFGDDYLHRIGGGAKNAANLGHILDAAEYIDGITVAHDYDKGVPGPDRAGVAGGYGLQLIVVAVHASQAGAGRLVEGDAELHLRYRGDDGFVNVFHRFDEVRLAEDEVCALWNLQRHELEFHKNPQDSALYTEAVPWYAPLHLMVKLVRDHEVSPVELVDAHLAEIGRRSEELNAFRVVFAEEARVAARAAEAALVRGDPMGLLGGVPVTVKDSFDVTGYATQAGSLLRGGHRATEDAAAVARLRSEGAILLGKTNTPDLLLSYETDNLVAGRTNNPWDVERTPGGSSGGEAAAIAAGCSPGGLATDGGGSIRVPAHFCGIAGLKPTPGRISTRGHFPSLGYPGGLTAVAGPMARTAEDLRLLFSVLAGFDAEDPFSTPAPLVECSGEPLRLGVWPQFYSVPVDAEIGRAVAHAAELGKALGWTAEAFEPRGLERAPNLWATLFRLPLEVTRKMIEGSEGQCHWTLLEALEAAPAAPSAEQLLTTLATRDRMRASLVRQMQGMDAVLMPVAGIAAFRHRERKWEVGGQPIGTFQAMMPAVVANVLGLPAVTIPMAISEAGLPLGVQLMGRPYEDERLLDAAVRLEEARGPWKEPSKGGARV